VRDDATAHTIGTGQLWCGHFGPAEAAAGRARRSQEYRAERDEYAAIPRLRHKNWIAAHIRERRYELDLTQHPASEVLSA